MPFKYSGNKRRLLQYLPVPPKGTEVIVEPFAGSMAYSLDNKPKRAFGWEINSDVAELWRWLREEATPRKLKNLANRLRKLENKADLRELKVAPALRTLARLTTSGVYTGQLSSWVHYAQHKVDFSPIEAELPYLQENLKVREGPFTNAKAWDLKPNVMYFVDPPYAGTGGNYKDKSKGASRDVLNAKEVADFCWELRSPTIFTYGDDAPEVFPMFRWHVVCTRKVPNIRKGGVKIRREHACFLNWRD